MPGKIRYQCVKKIKYFTFIIAVFFLSTTEKHKLRRKSAAILALKFKIIPATSYYL